VQEALSKWLAKLRTEGFVLGEETRDDRAVLQMHRVMQDYEQQYVTQWRDLLLDVTVAPAKDDKERGATLKVLATDPCPMRQLLQALRANTEGFKDVGAVTGFKPGETIRAAFASILAFSEPGDASALSQYIGALRSASDKLSTNDRSGLKAAEDKTKELLWKLDQPGQDLLGPLLLAPLGAKLTPPPK
jgi:hypothetical protein